MREIGVKAVLCPCGNEARRGQRNCKGCHAAATRKYRKVRVQTDEERKKSNCRSYLHVYVKRGKVTKRPCTVCGAKKVEAHHPDHSRPLDVIWLCRPHHVMVTRGILDISLKAAA